MKRWKIALIGSVASAAALGLTLLLHLTGWYGRSVSDLLEVPYRANPGVQIDGSISPGEYPGAIDLGERWQVRWVHDGTHLYLAMETPGHGWVGAGFMTSSPDPSNLGAYLFSVGFDDQGDVISVSGFDAGGAMLVQPGPGPQAVGRQSEADGTVVEFSLPLQLPPGRWLVQNLEPGSTYRFLVAYHRTSSVFVAYHGKHRRALDIRLAPIS
jgi:hypothetical protein